MGPGGQVEKILASLKGLGPRRLWQLALVGAVVISAVALVGYLASRPAFEVLYAGLDAQDVARITGVLRETNVQFDVTSDGGTLLVENGQASRARMILADRGLPRSASAGYELFDKLGSLGLTSFMQEMTRVRALEGELARSIQSMQGVRAARVHIAPSDDGGFRRSKQSASASVVVRLSSSAERGLAQAIRRLVSAATPGMSVDAVTVLSSDGSVLAAGGEGDENGPVRGAALEKSLADALQENVRHTLAPIVGARNLNVSVALRLNTDRRQTTETTYNPESRVERSVRVVKESQTTQNPNGQAPTSVERNIPNDKAKSEGKGPNEESVKKEELTNYEISSKTVQTTAAAYSVERVSIAVLINRASLVAGLGEKGEAGVEKRLSELSDLVSTAAGVSKDRGDAIKLSAIEFSDAAADLSPVGEPGLSTLAFRQIGAISNALAIIVVVCVAGVVTMRLLSSSSRQPEYPGRANVSDEVAELPAPTSADQSQGDEQRLVEFGKTQRKIAQERLASLVDADDQQAAEVLRDWLRREA